MNIDDLLNGKEIDIDIHLTYGETQTPLTGINIKGHPETDTKARLKISANYYNKKGEKVAMSPLNDIVIDLPREEKKTPKEKIKE